MKFAVSYVGNEFGWERGDVILASADKDLGHCCLDALFRLNPYHIMFPLDGDLEKVTYLSKGIRNCRVRGSLRCATTSPARRVGMPHGRAAQSRRKDYEPYSGLSYCTV